MKKSHTKWIRNEGKYKAMKKFHTGWIRNGGKYIITRFSHNTWYKNREGVRVRSVNTQKVVAV